MVRRFRAFIALAILALGTAACSSATLTRLAYNNAALAYSNLGPMLTFMVDDYVEIDGNREDWVRVRIDRALAWHRAQELPRYQKFFESVLAKSAAPFKVEDIAAHQREVRTAYHRLMGHVIPDSAEFLATLTPADVQHIEKKLAEDNRKWVKESIKGTPEERLERRVKRFVGHLESWVGPLEPEQKDLVAVRYREFRDLSEELMGERRYRQTEMTAMLKSRPSRAEIEAKLRHLFVDTDSWRRAEYKAHMAERDRQVHTLIADLSATLSERQRARLQKRIRGFMHDISSLTAST
jgi:hypothetical protein